MIGERGKRIVGASVLLGASFAVLLLPACGASDPTPTLPPTPTPTESAASSTPTPSQPTPTPTPGEPAATPTPAPPTFEEEWEALKARARAEGKLVLVTGNNSSRGLVPVVRGTFGEQFGIEVTITGGSGSRHAPRIAAERAAGRYEVDIVILGRTTVGERLGEPGFMTPLMDQLFHPDALDPSNWWMDRFWYREPEGVEPKYSVAFAVTARPNPLTPAYNTDLVTEADIAAIGSVWDFLDDKWKDQIIALSPLDSGSHGSISDMYAHPEVGPEWLARFYSKELGVTFVGEVRTIVDSIALPGGHAFSAFDQGAGTQLTALAAEGLPVAEWTKNLKEGGVVKTTSSLAWLGMMDRAPNPNAAKLFLNWWLTLEGQTAYHTVFAGSPIPSLREDVPPGLTLPQERRVPGAVYEMSSLDTSLPDLRAEAIEFAQRTFLER